MSSKTNPKKIKEIEKEKEKEKEDENTIVLWLENLKKEMKANEPDDFQDAALMLIKILQNKVHDIPLNIFMKKYNFKKLIYCDSCKLLRATDLIKKLLVDLCPDIKQETNFTHQKICPSLIKEPEKENYRNSSQLSITPVTKETERKKKKEILKEQFKEKSPIGKSLSQPSVKRKLELIQSEDIGKNLKLKPNMESNLFNEKRKSKNKAYFALKNKAEEKDEEETDLSELSSTEESEVNPILTLNDSDDIVVVNKEEEKMKKMIIEVFQQEIEKKEKEKKLKKEKKKEKKKMVQKDLVQKKMVQKDLVQKDLVQKEIVQKVEQKKIDKKMEKKEMEQKEDQKEREEKKELVVTKDLEEERQKKLKELMTNKYLLKQEMMNNVNKKEQIIETLDIKKEKIVLFVKPLTPKMQLLSNIFLF